MWAWNLSAASVQTHGGCSFCRNLAKAQAVLYIIHILIQQGAAMICLSSLCGELKRKDSPFARDSRALTTEIYQYLRQPDPKTRCLLRGWRADFRYLYGDVAKGLSGNSKLDGQALLDSYGVSTTPKQAEEAQLLLCCAIQTYFSLLMKLIVRRILQKPGKKHRFSWQEIILGTFAEACGIRNFSAPDWYCWPVFALDRGFDQVLTRMDRRLDAYERDTEDAGGCDQIKRIYEALIPKELRHVLGEFYTPGWLAEYTMERVLSLEHLNLRTARVLDPTCGAGTFLEESIRRKREVGCGLEELLRTVSGLDVNPLAVLTAKTGYLLAIRDLLDGAVDVTLPVYRADVIRIGQPVKPPEPRNFLTDSDPAQAVRACFAAEQLRAQQLERADILVGNPPWVNWEYLPEDYRKDSRSLWLEYSLLSAKGSELGFSKEDISVLITAVTMDRLLKQGGLLAFVIRQGIFKSARNGEGFRRFQLREGEPFRVLRVEDLSKVSLFRRAMTQAALFYAKKGEKTGYPVPYGLWEKKNTVKRFSLYHIEKLEDFMEQITISEQEARPSSAEPTAPWITAERDDLAALESVLGSNSYRARTGVFTGGANAVYWLRLLSREGDLVTAENLTGRARRKAEQITVPLEPTYIYPMLKGGQIRKWNIRYDSYLLCPHTEDTKIYPVAGEQLQREAPETWAYLCRFRDLLDDRKGFAGWERFIQQQEFQAVLRVGAYTFSPYKVVWKYIATEFVCAVISTVQDPFLGEKLLLPNEKVMYVSTESEAEAYYLCGVLSSAWVARCVESYMNPTSISAHVLDKLKIPTFDAENPLHGQISAVCKAGHGQKDLEPYLRRLDQLVRQLYGTD